MFFIETTHITLNHTILAFSALPPAIEVAGGHEEGTEMVGEPHRFEIWDGGFCRAQIATRWIPQGLRADTVLAAGASAGRALTRPEFSNVAGAGETPEFVRFARKQAARRERRAGRREALRALAEI
jgi:hypothetical protein